MEKETGRELHGIEVNTYEELFREAVEPEHAPNNEGRLYQPSEVNLHLRKDAPVVDAGDKLPGINDNYTGKAPDMGAYEVGHPTPHYGPRNN